MKVNIIGATGATGSELLKLCLKDTAIAQVNIFVRRSPSLEHDKLVVHIIDFDKQETWAHLLKGDVLFSCLGTTLKDAGSKAAQWKVDYEYQFAFAMAAKQNGIENYLLISSAGASPKSWVFYSKMKGQLEEAAKNLQFTSCLIFRPPLLIREGNMRTGEKIGAKVLSFFNKLGLLKSMQPMHVKELAAAMLNSSKQKDAKTKTLERAEIAALGT